MSKSNDNIGFAVEQINIDESHINTTADADSLMILPTKNLVLFPEVTLSVSLRRPQSEFMALRAYNQHKPIGIVCQIDPEDEKPTLRNGLFRYGVLADVLKIIDLPDGEKSMLVRAREAFKILGVGNKEGHPRGSIVAKVQFIEEKRPDAKDPEFVNLLSTIKSHLNEMISQLPEPLGHIMQHTLNTEDPYLLVNMLSTNIPCDMHVKAKLLGERNLIKRTERLLKIVLEREEEININMEIMRRVHNEMNREQRRAILQQQMSAIQEELYGDAVDELQALEQKAEALALNDDARRVFTKEMAKLRRINPQAPDYSVQYSYLETLLDLPWGKYTPPLLSFDRARDILNAEHYGLEKVKERILEQLAVVKHNPDGRSPILCLVGPPGVGKTSLGMSIAEALGRKYARVSLGGLHDEAEIRGHRRTYIGAMPGRVIDAIERAGSANPVIVLDEIDKIGNDYKGDPSAALLEVLDPEQNCRFHDNYLDVDFDLSKVLFVATANTLSTVPQPLIDRMEIIELSGYLPEEKYEIATRHLLPRIFKSLGLHGYGDDDKAKGVKPEFEIPRQTLAEVVDKYTGESGVRQFEKQLAHIARKYVLAVEGGGEFPEVVMPEDLGKLLGLPRYNRDRYEGNEYAGVVTGLAWTQNGGEILLVEASLAPGKGDRLSLTGNLGDVMKESATIALQWVKAHAESVGVDAGMFDKYNVHLHFPEGAIPKDGPSAGITIATAIVSALRGKRVRERVAMTGEITLRGKVLPVGGIKEKILAAKRAGITDIVLSEENRKDVEEISAEYVEGLTMHYVTRVDEVIAFAVTDIDGVR